MHGEAGRRGPDVRSDAWVRVELRESGGIEITLTSKVGSLYGDSITTETRSILAALGVTDALVTIEDTGALPFVIAARLEAAVRRARPDAPALPLERATSSHETSSRGRFRRSRLYLPGNEPKFMLNAALHSADGLILDLEDSVAPSEKDAARMLVRHALGTLDFRGAERMVRINQGERGLTDLEAIVPMNTHLVLIPKCESADDVRRVAAKVDAVREAASVASPTFLMPIVESARGAIEAFAIASASEHVVALAIGLEDYTADIGAERTAGGEESAWARAQVVNAARAAGVQPIDSVYSDVGNEEGLRASAARSKALGFDGMGCIHPRQIRVIHDAFAPGEAELERAKKIVRVFEDATAKGLGVVSLGTKMIDPPVVKRAVRTVELAIHAGRLSPDWREEADS